MGGDGPGGEGVDIAEALERGVVVTDYVEVFSDGLASMVLVRGDTADAIGVTS